MHEVIETMLKEYACHSEQDYINALKEIFQEIALLGLWRAKFFEKAAFYGGSALRILYQLDRFSEDLDFSLLEKKEGFSLEAYNVAIKDELNAFGFSVEVETKVKAVNTAIESAFIKANTQQQLLVVNVDKTISKKIHPMQNIKIKMEVDTDPPGLFTTEAKVLLLPIPFSVITYSQADLFAGKLHALLCRGWQQRVKGRDWYDFVWYLSRQIPVNLVHLQQRLQQSGAWQGKEALTLTVLQKMLKDKIAQTDFIQAKKDVLPFIKDDAAVALWSSAFFTELSRNLIAL
jgi:predicted nucleotidyltransferase component of viral defense system